MASNRPAPAAPYAPKRETDTFGFGDQRTDEGPFQEWNPTEESIRPVRGRHRVTKQRGGGLARSSTVLGVGVIAAVGAGGTATADTAKGTSGARAGAGDALRARIMAQVEHQQEQIETKAAEDAAAAAEKAAKDAVAKAEKEAKAKAAEAKEKAEEEARKKAEAERLAALAKQFTLPTSSYTLTSTFGQAGAYWSSGYHTGLDFAAPTGTPIKAVHSGTITEAGWNGSYGYKTVLTLDDGTEIWYAHQSSIGVSVGQKVSTGDVIGRVGATGNVTGAHLHLEVHSGGSASGIDPMAWLRGKGLTP